MATDKLEKLRAQRDALAARIRREESRTRSRERKEDTRRKILAGAFLLEQAKRDPAINEWMTRGLARFLVRPEEKAMFDGLVPQLVTDKAEGGQPETGLPPTMTQAGSPVALQ
jgi:hypothetical protein